MVGAEAERFFVVRFEGRKRLKVGDSGPFQDFDVRGENFRFHLKVAVFLTGLKVRHPTTISQNLQGTGISSCIAYCQVPYCSYIHKTDCRIDACANPKPAVLIGLPSDQLAVCRTDGKNLHLICFQ